MNPNHMKLDLLLHSLVFKLMAAEDEEEREFLMEVWESAIETRREYLDELNRLRDEGRQSRFAYRPKMPLSDDEKAQRRRELIERNSKWN